MGTATETDEKQTEADTQAPDWHVDIVLRLGDDALVLAQRASEWAGHGPVLEEDLAMANIGLDLLGQARMLLTHAGKLEAKHRDEDALAYFRDSPAFRNHSISELPNGKGRHEDYAVTIARHYLHSERMVLVWTALAESSDAQLVAIAAKAIKEAKGHLRHGRNWLIRFGDGTEESHDRAQTALDLLWPYTQEYWVDDEIDQAAANAGVSILPSKFRADWQAAVTDTLAEATLSQPEDSGFLSSGKRGQHTEHMDYLLAEMQQVARAHPGAKW